MQEAQEKKYLEIKRHFQDNYFRYIKPKLEDFEQKRKKTFTTCIFVIVVFLILAIALIICSFVWQYKEYKQLYEIGTVLCLIIPMATYWIQDKNFENTLKRSFMPTICSCFENLNWDNKYHGNSDYYTDIQLVEHHDSSSFDDYFSGTYNDVPFEIIETKLSKRVTESSSRGVRTRYKTIFEGVILKINSVKNFTGHTVIKPDNLFKMENGGLRRTELEDVFFEKFYDVYTNDEVEARYIITTGFMERLNKIRDVYRASSVRCAFISNTIYVALDSKRDMFKLGSLHRQITNPITFILIFGEILSIYKLIDHFKFTQKV
ncbi:DUF3137 domain-containing protein [bacterium]|nr:DUF3137 domain-containing protein [bacterium]